jgi:hypothetical protein
MPGVNFDNSQLIFNGTQSELGDGSLTIAFTGNRRRGERMFRPAVSKHEALLHHLMSPKPCE